MESANNLQSEICNLKFFNLIYFSNHQKRSKSTFDIKTTNMKITTILFVLFLCMSNTFAQVSPVALNGSVRDGEFTLNRAEIEKKWKVKPVVSILGKAERPKDGSNKTHTYDRHGIVLFEKQTGGIPSDSLLEVQFYLSEVTPNTVTPTGIYKGNFSIEKVSITKDFTSTDLKEKLKDYKHTDSYMEHVYRISKMGLYIFFQYSDDEQTLQKISIGKDMRPEDEDDE